MRAPPHGVDPLWWTRCFKRLRLFVVGGALMAEPALNAIRVVEALDVVEERGAKVGSVRPGCRVVDPGEFAFEGGPEGFDGGVVVAVAGRAEGLVELEFSDALRERERGVGGATVAVMHDAAVRTAPLEGHQQGVGDEFAVRGVAHRPADDASGPQVDDGGEMQPAFVGAELGDVGRPDLVGSRRREVPVDQIRRRRAVGAAAAPPSTRMHAHQASMLASAERHDCGNSACRGGAARHAPSAPRRSGVSGCGPRRSPRSARGLGSLAPTAAGPPRRRTPNVRPQGLDRAA